MEQHLAEFLLKSKYCPVGRLGSLQLKYNTAHYLPAEKMMAPALPSVELTPVVMAEDDLADFIAAEKNCSPGEARILVRNYFDSVNALSGTGEKIIPGIGRFFAGPSGSVQFREQPMQDIFFPPVPAERIIRPHSQHSVLVGDRETNSSDMAAELIRGNRKRKSPHFVFAGVAAAVSALLIIWYVSQYGTGAHFGNRWPVEFRVPEPGYKTK